MNLKDDKFYGMSFTLNIFEKQSFIFKK